MTLLVFILGGVLAKNLIEGNTTTTVNMTKEQQMIVLINNYRQSHNLRKLTMNVGLRTAARLHSQDMLARGYFDHRGFPDRVRRHHQSYFVGENIAFGNGGSGTAKGVMYLWQNSPPHKAILLTAGWKKVGVGIATGTYDGANDVSMTTADFSS
jgi:uncharacterized protein YkwD